MPFTHGDTSTNSHVKSIVDNIIANSPVWRYPPATWRSNRMHPALSGRYLQRPRFGFTRGEAHSLLDWIESYGRSVIAAPLADLFVDEADKKFYEAAKVCGVPLVTGDLKHFPEDPLVMGVTAYLEKYE